MTDTLCTRIDGGSAVWTGSPPAVGERITERVVGDAAAEPYERSGVVTAREWTYEHQITAAGPPLGRIRAECWLTVQWDGADDA